jgi:hypothetical protein
MPVTNCGPVSVLTGQDGMITMKPPGTLACLLDKTDFPAPVSPATTSVLSIPPNSDFRVNDPVTFTEKGTANLDAAITDGTVYYIKTRPTPGTCTISATLGGAALAFTGNGGSGGANTPGDGNHIEMSFATAYAMCEVPSADLTLTRGEIDVTSIPCKPGSLFGPKLARFRRFQAGFADGSGTLTLRLTEDRAAFTTRLIQGTMFNDQHGAVLNAYFHAVATTGNPNTVDDAASLPCSFPVVLLGFSSAISQDDSPTEVSVNYRISDTPSNLMGLTGF